MASNMGTLVGREMMEAIIKAARHANTKLPDLTLHHTTQLATMRRMVRDRDKVDGLPNSGAPDAPKHKPGATPDGVGPYKGPRNRNKSKGEYGEDVTDMYMGERGFDRISHREGPNGIDGIYANRNGDVVIVESKYNTSQLGDARASKNGPGRNRQLSDGWLNGYFHNHGNDSRIADALKNEPGLARYVEKLFRAGEAPAVVARVMPDGSVDLSVPRFDVDGKIIDLPAVDF